MPTAPAVVRSQFKWHTRATWSAREDRIPSLAWLALIWFGIVAGFGVDMRRFLDESPPPAAVVDVHAVAFTVWLLLLTAQVLLVVGGRVALHRRLGWFMTGWAGLMVVLGAWTAMVAWDAWRGRLMKQFVVGAIGLVVFQCLLDFLYHWGPWKGFAAGLVAAWGRHMR